jgi:broad specificity phosphatase PhoE
MKTLTLIRHGESEWNREGRIQGEMDCDLSDLGRRQALLLGERLGGEVFDAAYASTATRAMDTGRIAVGSRMRVEPRAELREINLGAWEGELVSDLKRRYPRDADLWFRNPSRVTIDGAETLRGFRRRVTGAIDGILSSHDADSSVVVFAHGGVICSYLTGVLGLKLDDLWRFRIRNASLTRLIFPLNRPRIDLLNDVSHLDGALR